MLSRRARRNTLGIVRAVIGVSLLAFLASRVDLQQVASALQGADWRFVVAAFLIQCLATVLRTLRWSDLLHAARHGRRFVDLLAWLCIGLFFNSFLPTGIGGDVVRGYYTSRGDGSKVTSYASLVVERALGLISLAVVAATAALVTAGQGGQQVPQRTLWLVALGGGGLALAGLVAFAWQGWLAPLRRLEWFGGGLSRAAVGLTEALELFRRPQARRVRIVLVSFGLQLIAVLFHLACARAVGLATPSAVFFLIVPASIVASMLPISLNGLGLREGALVGLLLAYGAPSGLAAAFALLALLVATLFPLMGGLVYAFRRGPETAAEDVRLDR